MGHRLSLDTKLYNLGDLTPKTATYGLGGSDLDGVLNAPRRKGLILLVEDDFLLRKSVAEFLTWYGYEVKSAADGLDALVWLDSSPRKPSLILLDLSLPRIDGVRFLSLRKSMLEVANIPVIAITGDAKRRSNLTALGFRDAFFKPLDLPKLLQTIRTL